MAEKLETTATLVNDKVKFTTTCRSFPAVTFDYHPPMGDDEGYTGLEGLLMSLAACSGTALAFLLRKMKKDVSGLRVNATGTRREQPPFSLAAIHLEFILDSKDAAAGDVVKAIQLAEESYCPVWAMVKNNAEITSSYKISLF